MNQVRIYCKSRETSQSGLANAGVWMLEPLRTSSQSPEPLMGWTQSGDTLNQIKMEFPTRERAETFAKEQGWRYTSEKQNIRKVKPRNYAQGFVCDMIEKK